MGTSAKSGDKQGGGSRDWQAALSRSLLKKRLKITSVDFRPKVLREEGGGRGGFQPLEQPSKAACPWHKRSGGHAFCRDYAELLEVKPENQQNGSLETEPWAEAGNLPYLK